MTDPVSKILTGAVRISESHKTRSAGAGRPKTGKQLPDGCQHPCQGQQSFQHSRGKIQNYQQWQHIPWWNSAPGRLHKTQPGLKALGWGNVALKEPPGCDNKVILICPSCVLGHSHMQILSRSTVFVHLQSPSVIQICVLLSYNTLV